MRLLGGNGGKEGEVKGKGKGYDSLEKEHLVFGVYWHGGKGYGKVASGDVGF